MNMTVTHKKVAEFWIMGSPHWLQTTYLLLDIVNKKLTLFFVNLGYLTFVATPSANWRNLTQGGKKAIQGKDNTKKWIPQLCKFYAGRGAGLSITLFLLCVLVLLLNPSGQASLNC